MMAMLRIALSGITNHHTTASNLEGDLHARLVSHCGVPKTQKSFCEICASLWLNSLSNFGYYRVAHLASAERAADILCRFPLLHAGNDCTLHRSSGIV